LSLLVQVLFQKPVNPFKNLGARRSLRYLEFKKVSQLKLLAALEARCLYFQVRF
jgi:hypothetical protein